MILFCGRLIKTVNRAVTKLNNKNGIEQFLLTPKHKYRRKNNHNMLKKVSGAVDRMIGAIPIGSSTTGELRGASTKK